MKKPRNSTLFLLSLLPCMFLLGLFAGRNCARTEIILSTTPADVSAYTIAPAADRVNINTAGIYELMTLPGIGKTLAQRIVDYREANGAFTDPAMLLQVEGIGSKTLSEILNLITMGG